MASLEEYRRKRRFESNPEPFGKHFVVSENRFVVQKHAATRLHYDLRLEIDGVLKSWAVPKGPSLNPADKRLAIQVEDHPLEYRNFEGVIPKGHYGAGEVIIWDQGTFEVEGDLSASEQLERGELKFRLQGQRLQGSFVLVKLRRSAKGNEWLLIKHKDFAANPDWKPDGRDRSVVTRRTLEEIKEEQTTRQPTKEPETKSLERARKATMPSRVGVTLAASVDRPFSDPGWLFEIKWDGVRALAWLEDGDFRLLSRSGRSITQVYPEFEKLPAQLAAKQAILDGEIVVLDENGRSNFEKLQSRIGVSRPSAGLQHSAPATYYIFDILYCDGYDLRRSPLLQRKLLLRRLLEPTAVIRYSDHLMEKGKELFELAKQQRLEGIIGKRIDSPYPGQRTSFWVKLKVVQELDAVIAGWTTPRGTREHFGALVLGLFADKHLHFIGSVGSGFTHDNQKDFYKSLRALQSERCPFEVPPKLKETVEWVKPSLVVRVKFSNWTDTRRLRAPVFVSLRKDKRAEDCRLETERPAKAPRAQPSPAIKETVLVRREDIERELSQGRSENTTVEIDRKRLRLTHLNKVYFPESAYTKRDLLFYYYRMAGLLLPFLRDRPLVLRRYPEGIHGESFFQKEAAQSSPEWMKTASIYSKERKATMEYFTADDTAALLYLTNLGCIDHNPWSSRVDDEEHPDYVFFDLDPTEGTDFETVLTVARAVYQRLQALKLTAYLKTSGATGFHIYIPLAPLYTYEQVRTFAEIVGRLVAEELPRQVTLERSIHKRPKGRILLDALQNAHGKPLAAVYAVRPFPKAPVSTPVTPDELRGKFYPEQWNLTSIFSRLEDKGNLWKDFWKKRQRLEKATMLLSRQLHKPGDITPRATPRQSLRKV